MHLQGWGAFKKGVVLVLLVFESFPSPLLSHGRSSRCRLGSWDRRVLRSRMCESVKLNEGDLGTCCGYGVGKCSVPLSTVPVFK